jgi:hypothetical protein
MTQVNSIKQVAFCLVAVFILIGCSSDRLYQAFGSPDPVGLPVRYPLDYPICKDSKDSDKDTGEIVVPLQIRIYTAGIADPSIFTAQRKKDPSATGCLPYTQETQRSFVPKIHMSDHYNYGYPPRGQMLDMSGRGYFASVSYFEQLLNTDDLVQEREREIQNIRSREENEVKFGHAVADTVELDEEIEINDLIWRHKIVARYSTPDLSSPRACYELCL